MLESEAVMSFFLSFFFFGRQQRLQVEEGAGEVFLKAEAE